MAFLGVTKISETGFDAMVAFFCDLDPIVKNIIISCFPEFACVCFEK